MMSSGNKYVDQDLLRENVADFERHIIVSALKRTHGNQSEAARQLGTTRKIFAGRVRKYKIDTREFLRGPMLEKKEE
jgi:DNA-binding NtrC family response regulator